MRPKLPVLLAVVGSFSSVWLKTLKNSPRIWNRIDSCEGRGKKFLISPVSTFQRLGPRNAPLPTFPKVPIAGRANREVLRKGTQVVGPHPPREPAGAAPRYSLARPRSS